ncbi:hypothetical protein [Gemmatimonas sp.]
MMIPDPLQSERESLVKAEADAAHLAEANRRAAAAAEAELVAPLATRTAALPERLTTLRYLDPADQQLYARDMDGSFVLAYVRIDDTATMGAYADRVGKGLSVLGMDETPASRLAQQHRQKEMQDKVNDILERDAKAAAEKRIAEIEARHNAEVAKLNAEKERELRGMQPGGMTRVIY